MHKISLHRALKHLRQGGLHDALGVDKTKPIPEAKMEKARKSPNPHVRKMAQFADTMAGWNHGGKDK